MVSFDGSQIASALLQLRSGQEHIAVVSHDSPARLHLFAMPSGGARWTVWNNGETYSGTWLQRDVHERLNWEPTFSPTPNDTSPLVRVSC